MVLPVAAQFQFFEQMFNGGGRQQQQPQEAPSDSSWYRQHYEAGKEFITGFLLFRSKSPKPYMLLAH